MPPLETDTKGNIIIRPVVGYTTHSIAGTSVLLAVQYVETEEGFHTGHGQVIQLGLTPRACLELAEALKSAAAGILGAKVSPGSLQ
jgi:hypothetical protein